MSITSLAEKFYELRAQRDVIQDNLSMINSELDQAEKELIEEFSHNGLSRIDLQGKGVFSLTKRSFYKTTDKQALTAFLEQEDATDLQTVNYHTLNGWAKEIKEKYGDDFVIPGVAETTEPQIRLTKPKN